MCFLIVVVPEGSVKRGVFPQGLIYLEDFISEELEEKLINSINWTSETSAKQGVNNKL